MYWLVDENLVTGSYCISLGEMDQSYMYYNSVDYNFCE
jgi:hypothetical protein